MKRIVFLSAVIISSLLFSACESENEEVKGSWIDVESPTDQWLSDIHFTDDVSGWAVGWFGTILRTTDGQKWESKSVTGITDEYLYGIAFSDKNHGVFTGYNSDNEAIAYSTRNGGASWSKVMLPVTTFIPRTVVFADESVGYIAGSEGVVLKTTDGGQSWNEIETPVSTTLYGIEAFNTKIYACGSSTLLFSADGGSSWQQKIDAEDGYGWLKDIVFTDDNNGYFITAGGDAKIYKTSDGGDEWEQQASIGEAEFLNDIHFVGKSYGWAVGDKGIIYHTKNGNDWTQVDSPLNYELNAVFFSSEKNGWTAGYNGTLMHFN